MTPIELAAVSLTLALLAIATVAALRWTDTRTQHRLPPAGEADEDAPPALESPALEDPGPDIGSERESQPPESVATSPATDQEPETDEAVRVSQPEPEPEPEHEPKAEHAELAEPEHTELAEPEHTELAEPEPPEPSEPEVAPVDVPVRRALVVTGNPHVATEIAKQLPAPYQASVIHDSRSLKSPNDLAGTDLLLLDERLPYETGFSLINRLRKNLGATGTPTILFSRRPEYAQEPFNAHRKLKRRADAYIEDISDTEQLERALQEALQTEISEATDFPDCR